MTTQTVPRDQYDIALAELRKAHKELHALKQALLKLAGK